MKGEGATMIAGALMVLVLIAIWALLLWFDPAPVPSSRTVTVPLEESDPDVQQDAGTTYPIWKERWEI